MIAIADMVSLVMKAASEELFPGVPLNPGRQSVLRVFCECLDEFCSSVDLISVSTNVEEGSGDLIVELLCPYADMAGDDNPFYKTMYLADTARFAPAEDEDGVPCLEIRFTLSGLWEKQP